jgi:hypothetical protein
MKMHVVAVGSDVYWLRAVQNAMAAEFDQLETINCSGNLHKYIDDLPKADAHTLLLVDASGQRGIQPFVAALRARGWRYVIVVAANPSVKEAIAILRGNSGFDYWHKTYDESEIKNQVLACSEEILLLETLSKKEGFSTEAELIQAIYGEDFTGKVAPNDSQFRDLIERRRSLKRLTIRAGIYSLVQDRASG